MFIGRKNELSLLEELYASPSFEFLILYGRRRVGKTALLSEFARGKNAVFFSAQEKNDELNLSDLSRTVQTHFDGASYGTFDEWGSALEYIGRHAGKEKLVLIIDEFPFIAAENPSVKSILQHTIDHSWKEKNIFLILCGSSVSFMEKEVMGYASPLYGRSTSQLELMPFDYLDAASFFPGYSTVDKLISYGILGGIPCYLENFSDTRPISGNIARNILRTGSFLKEEPQVILRMELREPAVYNSIFEAIAGGASRLNEIAGAIHEDQQKCGRYLSTLRGLRLIGRNVPAGEDDSARRTLYAFSDNYFRFWYHYIFRERSYIELAGPDQAAREIMAEESISDFMGPVFEDICRQYMARLAKAGKLPFIPHVIGKWWGNDPKKRRQEDMDILLLDRKGEKAICCECKFRNALFDKSEWEDLLSASEIFHAGEKYYYLFSKSGFTDRVCAEAEKNDRIRLVTAEDLFAID